jgi:hypothetical protein
MSSPYYYRELTNTRIENLNFPLKKMTPRDMPMKAHTILGGQSEKRRGFYPYRVMVCDSLEAEKVSQDNATE